VAASPTLRVLIVAGDSLARAGLAAILAAAPELSVAGQIEPASSLEPAVSVFRPDVALWDLGWASEGDLALLTSALESVTTADDSAFPVVALLADESAATSVWQTGVRGVLSRSAPVAAVSAALTAAAQGLIVADPRLTAALSGPRSASPDIAVEPLTPREQEVLQLMAQGYANKTIARELGITEHTVKFHVNAVLAKLGAQSRTEAVVVASRAGLVLL
jgi:DNA-binding NarL/FixJ family response regulator